MSMTTEYPNTPQPILDAIRSVVPALPGWITAERGCELADAVLETKPRLCVELGVFGGRSLISQAFALRHLNCGVIAGVDPWRKEDALEGENLANQQWWSKANYLSAQPFLNKQSPAQHNNV